MPHPLEQKIAALGRQARRLLLLYGMSWVVAIVLLTVLLVGLADWLFRFEDPGLRLMATAGVLLAGGWAVARYLWTAARQRYDDVAIALRIERRFPALNDRLASTVQFLNEAEDDPKAGSAELRRAVIHETTAAVSRLDLREVIQVRPTVRITLAAVACCGVAAILALAAPQISRIALARLVNPLGSDAWPQQNHLQMREPVMRVALGQPLELAVVDAYGARLPQEVRLRMRYSAAGDQTAEDVVSMQFGKNAFVHRLDSVTRAMEYKAEGGDDTSMAWTQLEVVEPPAVETLQVTLHPPAYTGWPSETADKHFRAIKGTRVALRGASSKRLTTAAVKLENGTQVPARVLDDGYGFTVPTEGGPEFIVSESGSYSFELKDSEGFIGGTGLRYEMRITPDIPPAVTIELPRGNVYVTAKATVPIVLAVKDDLAIRDASLVYLRSDTSDQGDTLLPLYEGPEQVDPAAASSRAEMGESRRVEHRWELAGLELKPGTQVTFHGIAHDYLPQSGQSQPGRITIITPEELAERIAQRQAFILGELARTLKMQQDSRSQVTSLEIQLKDVGHLERPDVDKLQGAELAQRQVQRALADPSEGVPSQIQGLLDDLANNKLDSPDVQRRMQQLREEIQRIEREHLKGIEQKLQGALKGAQTGLDEANPQNAVPADKEVGTSLTAAGEEQDRVIAALEQMLGDLAQWDNYRRFQRDIGQLRNEQEQVQRETNELGRETLTKDLKDLTPQQQANLKKLGQRQAELGRRFDRMLQQMEQMGQELDQTDPLAAGVIDDATHQAREQGTAGQMREAAQNVEQNQVGQAGQNQQQVNEKLDEMLDILANRSERELSRLVKKLREAEQELNDLRSQQQGLRKKMEDAAKNPNENERRRELERLSREQRDLQDKAERMARKLQRLQAPEAGRSASKAGSKMAQAGQQGEQGDSEGAQESAEAAERDLDEAQQALAERRKQAEVDLAVEQLAKIADSLKSLHSQQQEIIAETGRLEAIRQSAGKWTRGQTLSVRDLGRQQDALREETEALAKKLDAAEVFSLALKGAAREMLKAVQHLEQRETGAITLAAEQNALRRLDQLLESLQPDKPEPGEKAENQQQQGEGGQQGGQQADGIPSLSQLKLLKLMQEEVNQRTKTLEEGLARNRQLAPEQLEEYTQLAQEQQQLADLVLNLSQPSDKPPEEEPGKLPSRDPRQELKEKLKNPVEDGLLPPLEKKP